MLTVTDSAAEHLSVLLQEAEAPDGVVTRLLATEQGLQLGMDSERPDDASYQHDGKTVLVVDQNTSALLDDRTLELEESDEGPALSIS